MGNIKIISIDDYGANVNSGEDALPAIISALDDASKSDIPSIICFSRGRYDFFTYKANKQVIYISNTASEVENPDATKILGLSIDSMKDITIDGNDATIMCHGKMISIAVLKSENIKIKNLSIDYAHPTVTEMTVISIGERHIDCRVHTDSQYRITDGKLTWYGENFSFSSGISQIFDPNSGRTWREYGPMEDEKLVWQELSKGILRLYFCEDNLEGKQNPYNVEVGQVFQMRNPIRDQVGVFIYDSTNISLESVTMHFMHGLGIIAQNSKDIDIQRIKCIPSNDRTCASFADFLHFSGCSGLIRIQDSKFIGANDDVINVHGTHLQITDVSDNTITMRFMHYETYGICGFNVGDMVEAVDADTLCTVGSGIIKDFRQLSPYELSIILGEDKCGQFKIGDVIENVTCTPEVIIKNNYFERIPSRGVLITTRRKVIISDNTFNKMVMSGILIANDAKFWFESGQVKDVLVERNTFIECGEPVVYIEPENTVIDIKFPVHQNIKIKNNTFICAKNTVVLSAKSVKGLWFTDNVIKGKCLMNSIITTGCSNVHIESNISPSSTLIVKNQ